VICVDMLAGSTRCGTKAKKGPHKSTMHQNQNM